MRNILLAAPAVSYVLIATLPPTKGQVEAVKLYCITKIYENGEPQYATIDDMKIDFDRQTMNDHPVAMTTKDNIVSWIFSDADGVENTSINKSTWAFSIDRIRSDGVRLQYVGTCSLTCDVFSDLPEPTKRFAYKSLCR